MKKNLISGAVGALTLLLVAGCRITTPTPIADENAKALPEPISYYGDVELFDEKSTPLVVMVANSPDAEETYISETLKSFLNKSNINCVSAGKPCDIQININSAYSELTPVPQCRLSHILSISVSACDGTKLLPVWEHKTEALRAYSTLAEAKAKLTPQIKDSIKAWEKNNFQNEAGKFFKASIVRFKMSRKLIELNPIRFEEDLRSVLNKLRKLNGVVDVRMIEANKESRIASFRVLYRDNLSLKNEIKKQK